MVAAAKITVVSVKVVAAVTISASAETVKFESAVWLFVKLIDEAFGLLPIPDHGVR